MVTPKLFLVKREEIEDRLDVQYFTPEMMDKFAKLHSLSNKLVPLGSVCESVTRGKQPVYIENGKIPIVKTADIKKDGTIDWENVLYTTKEEFDKNISARINQKDILLTSTGVGSLGKLVFVNEEVKAVADGHITIIRVNQELAMPRYVFTFLQSRFGQVQIERRIKGSTGQIEIYPGDIKTILVPIAEKAVQEKILKIYEEFNKRKEKIITQINSIPEEIESLLEKGYSKIMEKLGISYPMPNGNGDLLIVPAFKITDRLDFNFHKKDCTKMISAIRASKTAACELKDMVTFRKEKLNVEDNLDKTFNYSAISDIDEGGIFSFSALTGRELPSRAKNIVRAGDLLIPLLWTSREKVAIVQEEYDNFIVSTGFAVAEAKPNTYLPYLYTMLKSKYLQKQIEQRNTGGIMESISIKELGELTLPCPEVEVQKECFEIFSEYKSKADQLKKSLAVLNTEVRDLQSAFEEKMISELRH